MSGHFRSRSAAAGFMRSSLNPSYCEARHLNQISCRASTAANHLGNPRAAVAALHGHCYGAAALRAVMHQQLDLRSPQAIMSSICPWQTLSFAPSNGTL